MEVLWWLAPPLLATCLAMVWAGWLGRERDDEQRDDSDAALARMADALARPMSSRRSRSTRPVTPATPIEPSHGVAIRRTPRRPTSTGTSSR